MLVIPMWQPHASAVALGLKKIETRPRRTTWRGPVAIHAAKKWDAEIRGIINFLPPTTRWHLPAIYPLGQIIAIAELLDCLPTSCGSPVALPMFPFARVFDVYPTLDTDIERSLGDYGPGRYGWVLGNVRQLKAPLPYSAHQGCYSLDSDIERQVMERL